MISKYPVELNDAWVDACIKLWNLCDKYDRDVSNLTIWDAFRLLYLERVPKEDKGRRAEGINSKYVIKPYKRRAKK